MHKGLTFVLCCIPFLSAYDTELSIYGLSVIDFLCSLSCQNIKRIVCNFISHLQLSKHISGLITGDLNVFSIFKDGTIDAVYRKVIKCVKK